MRTASAFVFCFGAAIIVTGCGESDPEPTGGSVTGSGSTTGAGGSGSGATTGAGGSGGGGSSAEWTPIVTADWQLDPGSEKTSDIHLLKIEKDIYIGAIRPIAPVGTHHTVLAKGNLGASNIIYASGVGTNALVFPEGVGLKLTAGETLVLQLHLFNPSGEVLTGKSGIEIIEVDPAAVQNEADLFLPGPVDFSIPPNQEYSHTGTCTASVKQNIFAIFPHMHQLGTHFKTTLKVGGKDQVLHDDSYAFDHQAFLSFDTIALEPGDSITTECTWKNSTTQTIGWGESSTTEMCFSILYRYPAQGDGGNGFCNK